MGLGKTLSMISLMLRHRELVDQGLIQEDFGQMRDEEDEEAEEGTPSKPGWVGKKGEDTMKTRGSVLRVIRHSLQLFYSSIK